MTTATEPLRASSAQGRWVLAAAVLGSGMAMLDGTVVNIALRSIGEALGASVAQLQWVLNAYLLALASLILVGGALGDRFGRRRMFLVGVVWFAAASALCAVAQTADQLIVARLVQGVGAALLTPGSLAMIQGSFHVADRARVIGRWAGLGGVAAAVGPLLGGWVIDVASWRWIFWINVPIAAVVVAIGLRHVPETRDPAAAPGFDVLGAALGVVGLGGLTFALIESGSPYVVPAAVVGAAALLGFVAVEHRSPHPLVPLRLFTSRVFSVANAMTLLVYGALSVMTFFLVLQLQVSAGYTPLQAGLATVPMTLVMLVGSSRAGQLSARIGPRWPMTVGPVLCGVGALMLRGVSPHSSYWFDVLPGLLVFSLGLVALVAPLTATVLAAVPDRFAGVASGVNNAVARTGSLLAVAALPAAVGLVGADYQQPAVLTAGYREAMLICAFLLVGGGLVSFVGMPRGTICGTVTAPARATSTAER
jgi:EmrB/QacA subfamily drug resistance transporter